ncbi:MAG: hypothetical protein AAFR30_05365 [Cyanobacteria bacterium J06628_4]
MDNQTLLKEALTDELGSLYKSITQLTDVKSLPEDDTAAARAGVGIAVCGPADDPAAGLGR